MLATSKLRSAVAALFVVIISAAAMVWPASADELASVAPTATATQDVGGSLLADGSGILVPTAAPAEAASSRPLSDFPDAQRTFCLDDDMGGCLLFGPPAPNYIGWFDPSNCIFATFDYAGLANRTIEELTDGAMSLGTTIVGCGRMDCNASAMRPEGCRLPGPADAGRASMRP